MKQKRPDEMHGSTRRVMTGCGYIYVTVNFLEDKPFEVFVKLGKAGGCSASYTEAIGKIISVALRSGTELGEIAEMLQGVGCNVPVSNGAKSCSDGIAQVLSKAIITISLDNITTEDCIEESRTPSKVQEFNLQDSAPTSGEIAAILVSDNEQEDSLLP